MSDERWTVRQVAIWIRYRDAGRVDELGDEEQPFERTAREAIQANLAEGELIAYSDGRPIKDAFWKHAVFANQGRRAATLYRSHDDIMLESQRCMLAWPAPMKILSGEPVALRMVLEQMGDDSRVDVASPVARWFLTHRDALLAGLNVFGQRLEVDGQALQDARIGRHDNSIISMDGRMRWGSVTVALRAMNELSIVPRAHADHVGLVAATAEEVIAWARPIVERIEAAGHRMSRVTFEAMIRETFGERLSPKAVEQVWPLATPEDWRKRAQGAPKKGVMVSDWREYLSGETT